MKTCLVVDDSRVVRKAARRILEGLGFAVREAEDGAAGAGRLPRSHAGCVLLDWNMPVMDGIEFLRALRAAGWRPDAGGGVLHDRERRWRASWRRWSAGAQEYIMKPFDSEILERQVQPGRTDLKRRRVDRWPRRQA